MVCVIPEKWFRSGILGMLQTGSAIFAMERMPWRGTLFQEKDVPDMASLEMIPVCPSYGPACVCSLSGVRIHRNFHDCRKTHYCENSAYDSILSLFLQY